MSRTSKVRYSVLQYAADPSRMEFLNVAVVLADEETGEIFLESDIDKRRLKAFFGQTPSAGLVILVEEFRERLLAEFEALGPRKSLKEVADGLHNSLRLTEPKRFTGKASQEGANLLANRFLSAQPAKPRLTRVSIKLRNAFDSVGVLDRLDSKPEPVIVPGYNAPLRVPFGYQNGKYNLVDAARFDEPERAFEEVGKRMAEAKAISGTLDYSLCIVGDFGSQPSSLSDAVKQDLGYFGAEVYRWDEITVLAEKIRREAH